MLENTACDVIRLLAMAAGIGIGGTLVLDAYALVLRALWGVPTVNWPMVGRWIGHFRHGQFMQSSVSTAAPIRAEAMIGWGFHYAIGIGYGLLVLLLGGRAWFDSPRLLEPLVVSWVLLVLPYFVMMPGMGQGIAGSKSAHPLKTRLKSVAGHTVFGLGMYAAACAMAHASI